jgi:acetyl esterase/lipase
MNEPAPPADERVPFGAHLSQFVDFRYPAGRPRALAINIHGGFWRARFDLTHAGHPCVALTAAGYLTANIEYRRVGEDGGGWPGTIEDVRCAVRSVRERNPDLAAVLLGHSAGGHLALCMAAEMPDLRGVIAFGAVCNPCRAFHLNLGSGAAAEFFGGSPTQFPDRYAMAAPVCPTLLIHGTNDEVVPVEMAREFVGARLIEIAGADHFDPIDPETAAFQETLTAIERLCRPTSQTPPSAPR